MWVIQFEKSPSEDSALFLALGHFDDLALQGSGVRERVVKGWEIDVLGYESREPGALLGNVSALFDHLQDECSFPAFAPDFRAPAAKVSDGFAPAARADGSFAQILPFP